jgi:hypothetical protein
MKVVTLRNLSPALTQRIRQRARERGTSITRAVIGLLEERLGLNAPGHRTPDHDDLDALAGSWSQQDADAFDRALNDQRRLDPNLWK